MSDDGELLMDVCNLVIADPSLAPEFDKKTKKIMKTHCNRAALLVAQTMGCDEFNAAEGSGPLMADDMIHIMTSNASGKWKIVTGSEAAIHALGGGLAFAAKTSEELEEDHGHIAAVFPAGMQKSQSLGHDVPMVANCGKENGEERVSQAFPVAKGEPTYYAWGQES